MYYDFQLNDLPIQYIADRKYIWGQSVILKIIATWQISNLCKARTLVVSSCRFFQYFYVVRSFLK